jgi:hypothetical protein
MADDAALTALPATPVNYRFVSVSRIVGFSELRMTPELEVIQSLPLDLGVAGVSATLTVDPNSALTEVDLGAALGHLMMLRAFVGQSPPGDLLQAMRERAAEFARERLKKFGPTGVYLVLEARGKLVSSPTEVARDLGGALLAFDAVDKKTLKAQYAPLVSASLAAVALSANTTTDLAHVADGVVLTLPDARPLYSLTITGSNANLTAARSATDTDARAIEKAMASLIRDERLKSPSRLLVDALRSTADRLEAFIFGWAALEMVIRKFTVGCEDGEWVQTVPQAVRESASTLHERFIDGGHQHYSLAERTRIFALRHGLGPGEDLAAEITQLRKAYREPLYHEGAIADQFPVEAIVVLARKLLAAAAR